MHSMSHLEMLFSIVQQSLIDFKSFELIDARSNQGRLLLVQK